MVEHGLMVMLIAMVVLLAVGRPGTAVSALFAAVLGSPEQLRPSQPHHTTEGNPIMSSSLLRLRNRLASEKGATMVEYGLMVALIAVIVVVAVGPLGKAISTMFASVSTSIGG